MRTLSLTFLTCIILSYTSFAQKSQEAIMLQETRTLIFKTEDILNSENREANLFLANNGFLLFFMSGRGEQPWSNNYGISPRGKKNESDGDIWLAKRSPNGEWQKPQVMKGISTSAGEDEPNISPDGKTFYYQSWGMAWEKTEGPYYRLDLSKGIELKAVGLGGGITQFFIDRSRGNTPQIEENHKKSSKKAKNVIFSNDLINLNVNNYATDGMTISPDGKTFIVAVGEYVGKMDLYISRQDSTGKWSYLKRMDISTKGDERSPVFAPDGKTLYFASDAYNSLGGLDIFKTTLHDDNTCGTIENLGKPINTRADEKNFVTTSSGAYMMLIRNDDIISIKHTQHQIQEFPEIIIPKEKDK